MKGLAVPGEVAHGLGVAVLRSEEEVLEERHVARVGPGRLDQGARLAREEGVVALRALVAQDVDGEEDEHADLVVHGKRDEAVHLVVERRQRVEPGAEVRVQPLVARLGADVARGEAGRRQAAGRRGQDVQGQLAELDGLEKKGSGGPRMGLDRRGRDLREHLGQPAAEEEEPRLAQAVGEREVAPELVVQRLRPVEARAGEEVPAHARQPVDRAVEHRLERADGEGLVELDGAGGLAAPGLRLARAAPQGGQRRRGGRGLALLPAPLPAALGRRLALALDAAVRRDDPAGLRQEGM